MAQVALGVVGGVAGFLVGGPAGAAIGFSLGMAVGAPEIPGPTIGEIARQTAKEGDPRLIVWGIVRPVGPNLIAVQEPPVIHKVKQGGKGGSGPRAEVPFRTYALGVCEGPITGYRRIWRNNKLVYDGRPGSTWGARNSPVFLRNATLYYGDYSQLPDPDLEAVFGVGEVPAHRGTAYIVLKNEDLQDTGGAVPQWLFEVVRDAGSLAPVNESSELMVAHVGPPRVTRLAVDTWDTLPPVIPPGSGRAYGAEYTTDMRHALVSLESNPRLRVIDLEDMSEVRSENLAGNSYGGISRDHAGKYIAIAGVGAQRVYVVDQTSFDLIAPSSPGSNAMGAEFSRTSGALAVAHFIDSVGGIISNLSTYTDDTFIRSRAEYDPAVGTSNQGECVAWAADGDSIYLGQSAPGETLRLLSFPSFINQIVPEYTVRITSIDCHKNSNHVALGFADGSVQIISTKDEHGDPQWVVEREVTGLGSTVSSVRFSSGGGYFAFGILGSSARIYIRSFPDWVDLTPGPPGGILMPGPVSTIRWSPK